MSSNTFIFTYTKAYFYTGYSATVSEIFLWEHLLETAKQETGICYEAYIIFWLDISVFCETVHH